jgi:putative flippase GtrA
MSPPDGRGLAAEIGRFLRANLSSTAATALDWALVTALTWAGVYYLGSAAVGATAGAVTDFLLKRHWAFDRAAKGGVRTEGIRYLAVSGVSLGWNLLVSYALVDGFRLPPVPGVIAASVVVGVAWNYPLHRLFVFRHAAVAGVAGGEGGGAGEARAAVGGRRR